MAMRARRRRWASGCGPGGRRDFADGGGDDAGHADDEEEAEDGEDDAQGALHA